jgi:RNA polymerase sigma-70 factor, ECF subfamily
MGMLEGRQTDDGAGLAVNEPALVGRVAQGDLAAFDALYHCFYARLRRFLERMTRRPQMVDEIVNDTMLVVWRRANTYNLQSKVSTWIFAIAYRKALKALKLLDEPVDLDADEWAEAVPGPEGALAEQEMRVLLRHAMDCLPPAQRAVVELTYFHGCAYREIAEIMECPVDTVKTRMFHARRRLKKLLSGSAEDLG